MITEDYVSFETAKLLKEKGFDGQCFYIWISTDNRTSSLLATANFVEGEMTTSRETLDVVAQYHMNIYGMNNKIKGFLCPTLQMAIKWLREVHNIFICIIPSEVGAGVMDYTYVLYKIDAKDFHFKDLYIQGRADNISEISYEQTCEAAIKYCLENLL